VAPIPDREYREQTVTNEFQDLSTVAVDCLRLRIKQRIKNPDHPIARQPVRSLSELRRSEDHNTTLSSSPVPRRI